MNTNIKPYTKLIQIPLILLLLFVGTNEIFAAAKKTIFSIVNGSSWINSSHWSTTSGGSSCSCTPDESKDEIYDDCNTSSCSGNKTTALPIELISFTAEFVSKKVILEWTTASEINNDHFIIEKSKNSIDFEILTTVKGSGNSNGLKKYSVTDNNLTGETYYYRLKQIDFDGTSKYLGIKAVSTSDKESSCDLFIKPNPCIGRCEISFENCNEEEFQNARIMIFDAFGNAVYTSVSKQISNGKASYELDNNNNLKPSVYIIKGSVFNNNITKKLIKK